MKTQNTKTDAGNAGRALHDNHDLYVSLLFQDLEQHLTISNLNWRSRRNIDIAQRADARIEILRQLLVHMGELDRSAL